MSSSVHYASPSPGNHFTHTLHLHRPRLLITTTSTVLPSSLRQSLEKRGTESQGKRHQSVPSTVSASASTHEQMSFSCYQLNLFFLKFSLLSSKNTFQWSSRMSFQLPYIVFAGERSLPVPSRSHLKQVGTWVSPEWAGVTLRAASPNESFLLLSVTINCIFVCC